MYMRRNDSRRAKPLQRVLLRFVHGQPAPTPFFDGVDKVLARLGQNSRVILPAAPKFAF